ncbi:MerR family transcriptional regulator [Eubacterium sp. OF10-16]|nr:MerR family transcriptional regulator [Eubacterium sp. OF10-16]
MKRGENAYREYGEEDLTQLQTIALLRKCGCSIAAIKDVTDGKCTLVELLEKQIHMLEKQKWQEDLRYLFYMICKNLFRKVMPLHYLHGYKL